MSQVQTTGQLTSVLYQDGVAAIPGAFPVTSAATIGQDFAGLFAEAQSRPKGTVNRGRNRFYFTVHPERLRIFPELLAHPVLEAVSTEVLGPDWRITEVAFDVPLPGSLDQPWHRDFETPDGTEADRRLTSVAFNLTAVTVTSDMGPFEIAPGTQWDDGSTFAHGMFPDPDKVGRYEALAVRKMPRLGDMSVRSGLTVHRGTANRSEVARPVMIVGVVGPDVPTEPHGLQISRSFAASLAPALLARLDAVIVDSLTPLAQVHSIEGLVMGGDDSED